MSECFLRQEMLSAILLSIVLIHCELMPRGKLINNEQKKWASICPIFGRFYVWSVQDNAEELSMTLRIQDVNCLWREMSEQHGEWHNSWLSPSQIWVSWSTWACRHWCCSWIGVYTEPLHPGNICATRIPKWWKILQHLPTNYLHLLLQKAFEGLNGQ